MSDDETQQLRKSEGMIHANFLLAATDYISRFSSNTLRSHLNILLGDILRLRNLQVSAKRDASKVSCVYCHTPWRHGVYSVKVTPAVKGGKKIRRILRRAEANKSLSLIEKNLAKGVHFGNRVVVKCNVCKKLSKFKAKKEIKPEPVEAPVLVIDEKRKKKKKKKKKRKNAYCGLNPEIMDEFNSYKWNSDIDISEKECNPTDQDDDVEVICVEEVSPRNGTNSLKRKIEEDSDLLHRNLFMEIDKKKRKRSKRERIKANPLQITPLGAPCGEPKRKKKSKKSENFIPLEYERKMLTKSKKSYQLTAFSQNGGVFVNPFAQLSNNLVNRKKKNLSKWKQLIAEEDDQPRRKSNSLQDFLSAL